jgi:hypothetical protein
MKENKRHDCTNISSTITTIRDLLSAFYALDESAIKFYYFPHKLRVAQMLLRNLKYTIFLPQAKFIWDITSWWTFSIIQVNLFRASEVWYQ